MRHTHDDKNTSVTGCRVHLHSVPLLHCGPAAALLYVPVCAAVWPGYHLDAAAWQRLHESTPAAVAHVTVQSCITISVEVQPRCIMADQPVNALAGIFVCI